MSDLISRSELIEELKESLDDTALQHTLEFFGVYDIIRSQPTVEAKAVVHGEWIEHEWAEESEGMLISNFECSGCHTWKREKSNFCPECGADMRKKVE